MGNIYGLTGAVQNAGVYPVQPITLAAAATDQTITITWVEENAVGDMVQLQYSEGLPGDGTVTTEAGTALIGDGTNFTDYNVGDWLLIEGEIARIASIEDATHLTLAAAFTSVEEGVAFSVSTTWAHLTDISMGVETYDHAELDPEAPYFYRIRTHKRFKWSTWSDPVADITGA